MPALFAPVGFVAGEARLQEIRWKGRLGQIQKTWTASGGGQNCLAKHRPMSLSIPRQMSTRKDRTPDRHQGQKNGQLRISACKLSSLEAQPPPPLSGVSELGIDDEDCAQLAGEGLDEIGHDGCETVSGDEDSAYGAVALGWSNRMPTCCRVDRSESE